MAFERGGRAPADRVYMIGLAGAGHWVAAARAIAGSAIDCAAIDTAGFRFAKLAAFDNPDFLPGGAKYNDLPGMIALFAPIRSGSPAKATRLPPIISAAYRAAGHAR